MQVDLTGKSVMITGANRGIGYALARGFLEVGAKVTIAALEDDVTDIAAELSAEFVTEIQGIRCDIANPGDVSILASQTKSLDILVNNAGFEHRTPISDKDPGVSEIFRRIIETNVIGSFEATRAVLPRIPDGGRIIFTASIWGKTAVAEYSAYCASKHAIIGLTRSLSRELGPRKISVNAVCPGWVQTESAMRSLHHMAKYGEQKADALLEDIVSAQSFGGLMQPDDMVDTYLFLASDAARNITGQAWTVDRGELMQ